MRTAGVTRREAIMTLATGAVSAHNAFAAGGAFHCGGIDHLALAVDDIEKSVHFYARVFGATVMKEKTNARHYVKLGPNYVAMAPPGQGQTAPSINHFCPGIVNFDLEATKHTLDQMGIKYREAPPVGLFVPDPDGTLVPLWTENSWGRFGPNSRARCHAGCSANARRTATAANRNRPHSGERLRCPKSRSVLPEDPR